MESSIMKYGTTIYNQDMTPNKPHIKTGLYHLANQCVMQCSLNKMSPKYKPLNLRIRVGSLGLGIGEPFFEYGGDQYKTIGDFVNNGTMDMHAWLENDKGQIYDVHFHQWDRIATFRNKQVMTTLSNTNPEEEWNAMDPLTLAQKGFHYLAAPESIQELLFDCAWKVQLGVVKTVER
jgi:hypothetical protein